MKKNAQQDQISLPLQTRNATLATETETTNTDSEIFNVVFATGAKVRRCNIFDDEFYDEELLIEKKAIRTDRLNSVAPVLDTHEQNSLSNVIGVVVPGSIKVENSEARGSIKLDLGEENSSTIRKLRDGIIKNVSVGYVVHKYEIVCEDDDSVPLYRAIDWEPYEISLVPIGADANAGIRSNTKTNTWPCKITRGLKYADTKSLPDTTTITTNSNFNPNPNLNEATMTTKQKKKAEETKSADNKPTLDIKLTGETPSPAEEDTEQRSAIRLSGYKVESI